MDLASGRLQLSNLLSISISSKALIEGYSGGPLSLRLDGTYLAVEDYLDEAGPLYLESFDRFALRC